MNTRMKTTQTWKIGDCLQLLPEIPNKSIDMVLTDMPYEVTPCVWDVIIPLEPLWLQYRRIIKDNGAIVLTASQPFTSKLVMSNYEMFKYELIWKKSIGSNFLNIKFQPIRRHENILVFYNSPLKTYNPQMKVGVPYTDIRKKTLMHPTSSVTTEMNKTPILNTGNRYPDTVIEFSNGNNNSIHPTQKPVALFEYLIKTYTNEGDMVHDSCLGSGTTLEACRNLNRNCIGFESRNDWEEYYPKRIKADMRTLDAFY